MARQPSRPEMALQSGRHTGGGERQATPATFGRNHEEHVPDGQVPPHPLRGRDVCRSRPERQLDRRFTCRNAWLLLTFLKACGRWEHVFATSASPRP